MGFFPCISHGEAPIVCIWTKHDSAESLEYEYKQREQAFRPEIEACINAIAGGGSCSPSPEALYFLGQRWSVIEDFLNSLSAKLGSASYTIIPPSTLPENEIFRWLMCDWWNHHGVRRLVDLELVERIRYKDGE